MHILHYKLKSLKPKLQDWNKHSVGDFHYRVHTAQQNLYEAQLAIDQLGFSMDMSQREIDCLTSYTQALSLLNSFWKDKSKNVRFLEGDRNTAFSHRQNKIRTAQSHISEVSWTPPSCGTIKFNCDGSSVGSKPCGAIGIVIRDSNFAFLGAISSNIGIASPIEAEFCAVMLAVETAMNLSMRNICLETDSITVVSAF